MKHFKGEALGWEWREGVIELMLDHEPANEIGTAMLAELEKFVAAFDVLAPETSVCIIASARKSVFSAGADLRELYHGAAALPEVGLGQAHRLPACGRSRLQRAAARGRAGGPPAPCPPAGRRSSPRSASAR